MASGRTLYQDEYCGFGGGGSGGGGDAGEGAPVVGKPKGGATYKPCMKSYEKQPVGGISQARAEAEADATYAGSRGGGGGYGSSTSRALPIYDGDFVTTVYSQSDRGTHRVQPQWRDPGWSQPMRAGTSTLYEPRDRDPCNRSNFHVYRTTLMDPMSTPCQPLAVPDVHKLRYMQNNYMTADDWY